jgi:hypothetical protein
MVAAFPQLQPLRYPHTPSATWIDDDNNAVSYLRVLSETLVIDRMSAYMNETGRGEKAIVSELEGYCEVHSYEVC